MSECHMKKKKVAVTFVLYVDGFTYLLWVSCLLAMILDEVHKTMHYCFYSHQPFVQLLPCRGRGI